MVKETPPLEMIVIGGHPGSGKSTLGKLLAKQLHYAFLDKDEITASFAEALLQCLGCRRTDRESSTYVQQVKPLEYRSLLEAAYAQLEVGQSVVCAAPFTTPFHQPHAMECIGDTAGFYGARLRMIWVHASEAERHRRVVQRNADRDVWKIGYWHEYVQLLPARLPEVENMVLTENPDGDIRVNYLSLTQKLQLAAPVPEILNG